MYQDDTTVFELNKDCEVKLIVMIIEQLSDDVTTDSVTLLAKLKIFDKLRSPHLQDFYRFRMLDDLKNNALT